MKSHAGAASRERRLEGGVRKERGAVHSLTLRGFAARLRELSQRASLAFRNGELARRLRIN